MHALIIVDLEGIIGVYDFSDMNRNKMLMTQETIVVIDSLRTLGIEYITVCDAHDSGNNIVREELNHENLDIVTHLWNLDFSKSYDFALLIGYHAMAGTAGVIPHTFRPDILYAMVDDVTSGEIGIIYQLLNENNIPLIFVSADKSGIEEAQGLSESISVFCTKFHENNHDSITSNIYHQLSKTVIEVGHTFISSQEIFNKIDSNYKQIAIHLMNIDCIKFITNKDIIYGDELLFESASEFVKILPSICNDLNNASKHIYGENREFVLLLRDLYKDIDSSLFDDDLKTSLFKNLQTLTRSERDAILLKLEILKEQQGVQ